MSRTFMEGSAACGRVALGEWERSRGLPGLSSLLVVVPSWVLSLGDMSHSFLGVLPLIGRSNCQ